MDSLAPHRTLPRGEMLNWYRIERILGRGGFGVIYLAHDTNLEHDVAIKEYAPGSVAGRAGDSRVLPLTERHGEAYGEGLERFIKEARNLVRFRHANIVRVMSVFRQNNTAYMVMEFEEGMSLREHFAAVPGARAERTLKGLIAPIAEGLAEVHRHGYVHRDVKPANILVRRDGSPVLIDFGSARHAGARAHRQTLTALVSAGYAPLEQYDGAGDGQQGPWSDIYALGGVLYHAVSGSDPVDSTRRASALCNGGRDPLLPATLVGQGRYDDAFLRAIDWALAFRIADRPQSLGDWLPALLSGTRPAHQRALPPLGRASGVEMSTVASAHGLAALPADGGPRARRARPARRRPPVRATTNAARRRALKALAATIALGGGLWLVAERDGVRGHAVTLGAPIDPTMAAEVEASVAATSPAREPAASVVTEEARTVLERRAAEAGQVAAPRQAAESEQVTGTGRSAGTAQGAEATRATEAAPGRESARKVERTRVAATARAPENGRTGTVPEAAAPVPDPVPAAGPLARADVTRTHRAVDDTDIASVVGRFEALRRALAARDPQAMDALTEGSAHDQNRLFRHLMERFETIDVELTGIRVRNADETISATLRIGGMTRRNGDRATPSEQWRERDITSVRLDGEWSAIRW